MYLWEKIDHAFLRFNTLYICILAFHYHLFKKYILTMIFMMCLLPLLLARKFELCTGSIHDLTSFYNDFIWIFRFLISSAFDFCS